MKLGNICTYSFLYGEASNSLTLSDWMIWMNKCLVQSDSNALRILCGNHLSLCRCSLLATFDSRYVLISGGLSLGGALRQEYFGGPKFDSFCGAPLEPGTLCHCLIDLNYNPPLVLFFLRHYVIYALIFTWIIHTHYSTMKLWLKTALQSRQTIAPSEMSQSIHCARLSYTHNIQKILSVSVSVVLP